MTDDQIKRVLHGTVCQECARAFADPKAPGYPRTCDRCKPRSARRPPRGAIGGKTKDS